MQVLLTSLFQTQWPQCPKISHNNWGELLAHQSSPTMEFTLTSKIVEVHFHSFKKKKNLFNNDFLLYNAALTMNVICAGGAASFNGESMYRHDQTSCGAFCIISMVKLVTHA